MTGNPTEIVVKSVCVFLLLISIMFGYLWYSFCIDISIYIDLYFLKNGGVSTQISLTRTFKILL